MVYFKDDPKIWQVYGINFSTEQRNTEWTYIISNEGNSWEAKGAKYNQIRDAGVDAESDTTELSPEVEWNIKYKLNQTVKHNHKVKKIVGVSFKYMNVPRRQYILRELEKPTESNVDEENIIPHH